MAINNIRIGFGYDVHAFCEGSEIVIGGLKIPFRNSLKAHSDGDVLLHAICDALLGAAALGDIGIHFPDNDPHFKGISSLILLEKTIELISIQNYTIGNIDATIVAEEPKISPHYLTIRQNIAKVCQVDISAISIKATTNEKIGFVGRQEGIAAMATTLLFKKSL
ncbi:MAG: 2-C-methyl-D-erythritol 2,4-cyclodiphosphate synthase [Bacteroidetes bacterium HGW-Bacteroidetes-21]|jgi:2-C-methyl-D-erythritol 2,4-cyclodiphosphate synthase|nr:MAG: 2-C-methyl-D-erythritol 2,4-cyclodiphosphate synthase [Bacteroidetes bacterium HGW-Bacteroidetes-21]